MTKRVDPRRPPCDCPGRGEGKGHVERNGTSGTAEERHRRRRHLPGCRTRMLDPSASRVQQILSCGAARAPRPREDGERCAFSKGAPLFQKAIRAERAAAVVASSPHNCVHRLGLYESERWRKTEQQAGEGKRREEAQRFAPALPLATADHAEVRPGGQRREKDEEQRGGGRRGRAAARTRQQRERGSGEDEKGAASRGAAPRLPGAPGGGGSCTQLAANSGWA
ncbi:unnamed protein product [Prorocentrum cordatum]|uniref:Uncharacterized protein n=1 Tax=Prorocentrum cordatum TaxID=2364126 RepID=A0ABN9UAB4_9DINO|nr:unnamed protein product [Polarella glacialis]